MQLQHELAARISRQPPLQVIYRNNRKGKAVNLGRIIEESFEAAKEKPDDGETPGSIHRNRSKNFVESLACELEKWCKGNGSVASLSKHNQDNRDQFGMNELLFDVTVCQYSTVISSTSGKELYFVTKGLWLVESEMARDKRQALFDFNKLVLGNSENKLFVGPHVDNEDDYLRVLSAPAEHCSGETFVALIPHPDVWLEEVDHCINVWRWDRSENSFVIE